MTNVAGGVVVLQVQWERSAGGPPDTVTGVTITIKTAAGATVLGPTSTGVVNLATGLDSYSWQTTADQADDYVAIWNGTDSDGDQVQASEMFTVQPATTLLYASLTDLKHRVGLAPDNTEFDAELLDKLETASRKIDEDTGREGRGFGLDAVASPRIYEPTHATVLLVDEISAPDGVTVEIGLRNSWSLIDPNIWEFRPLNTFARGRPATSLRMVYGAWPLYFGPGSPLQQRVRVTAVWGWPAIPAGIKEACLIRAQRLFRRKGSPEGLAGAGDLGPVRISRTDSDYDDLIADYILDEV